MNSNLGLWLGILVLGLLAAYGNVQYFNQQTKMALAEQKLKTSSKEDLADVYANESVIKLIEENRKLKEEADSKREEVAQLTNEVEALKSKRKGDEETIKGNEQLINSLKANVKTLEDAADKAKRTADDLRKKAVAAAEAESKIKTLDENVAKLEAEKAQLVRVKEDFETNNNAMVKSAKKRIQDLQRDKQNLLTTINEKSEAVRQRMGNNAANDSDGQIISLDLPSRYCVLDLGSINNVRRGMRFEVVRWSMNDWLVLGTVEIKKVNYSTSEAVIVDRPSVVKECPVTGYVAKDPEERYSPYAATKDNAVIPLRTVSVDDASTMNKTNPIVVGDKIRNPLYERDKKLKFAFAGEPVVFSTDILKSRIQASGNIFQGDKDDSNCGIDLDTDFLILGRFSENPNAVAASGKENNAEEKLQKNMIKAKNAMKFAEQYGIPIIREVSLNNFLR